MFSSSTAGGSVLTSLRTPFQGKLVVVCRDLILMISMNLDRSWKKRRKAPMSCQLKNSLWLQDQENLVEYTRTPAKIQLVKLLKWRNCKINRVKMMINHLMLLQQSWDMNTQGA